MENLSALVKVRPNKNTERNIYSIKKFPVFHVRHEISFFKKLKKKKSCRFKRKTKNFMVTEQRNLSMNSCYPPPNAHTHRVKHFYLGYLTE